MAGRRGYLSAERISQVLTTADSISLNQDGKEVGQLVAA
jgi:hypothetical protein